MSKHIDQFLAFLYKQSQVIRSVRTIKKKSEILLETLIHKICSVLDF